MLHTQPGEALAAALNATRGYMETLTARPSAKPVLPSPPQALQTQSTPNDSAEWLARLTTPTVSRLIAKSVRERRLPP